MGTEAEILEGNWEKDLELSLDNATTTSAQGIVHNSHNPTIPCSSKCQSLAIKFANENNLKARRKLLAMYRNHLMNFKRSILINRRRWQQRLQRRQALLRSFFMQHIMELETSCLELIPIPKLGSIQVRNELPKAILTAEPVVPVYVRKFYEDVMRLKCEDDWISNFRMRKSSFEWICDQLKEVIQPLGQNSPFHKLVSHHQQIALGLYTFATGDNHAEIARMFQIINRPTTSKFIKFFADAILKKWGKQFLTMPSTEDECDTIGNAFYNASNMPPVVIGVLGVCELTTKSLKLVNSNSNEAANSSTIMQMLIDNKLHFRKVKFDSNQPSLFLEEINEISNLPPKLINEKTVSRFVVTPDTYYPLRKWLMHKYQEPAAPHEFDFNEAVDNLFDFRDKALQRLFSRWRILKWNVDLDCRALQRIALACCILHNVLEEKGEPFEKEWTKWMNLENTKFTMSTRFKPVLNVLQGKAYSWEADGAAEVREFLGRTISSTEM